ncbi:hypothetical protein Vadar_024197 [Vaccinium darrowii]|uniref:Uncharacterized protein n=1 Tax=Vaccinium darrowii TaxID=229202 RepID=A0ACB7XTG1_9ERIC|nr:hypothetical protein Vadar_024197 [Vaccinium darrowii]
MEEGTSSQFSAVAASTDGSATIDIKESGEVLENKYQPFGSQKPKIQTVQPLLREVESNKKSYDPRVVSIGPCHHGKPELETIERLKPSMVRQYVENRGVKIADLYEEVVKVTSDARKCYAEDLTKMFDDEEFTRMMFLDGCFTLHYICSIVEGEHEELKKIQRVALVHRDLLLLENQLPFLVLRVLMRASFGIALGEEIIIAFIKRIRGEPPDAVVLVEQMKEFRQQHSLALKSHPEVRMQDGKDKDDNEPIHLLELVRRQFIDPKAFGIGCVISSGWYARRSVKDLKTVGIRFEPSKTYQLTDIEFKSKWISGILTLPRIIIDDTTKSMLLNLAAFEACPDYTNDLGVTSSICFMDSIIYHEEDVKELRSKGILLNYLGTDKQVADLFNDISMELVPSPHAYVQVKTGMEYYYQDWRIQTADWVGELKRDYFRNPWTTIAVFYAVFTLILSLIQAYFTVFPSPDKH